MKKRRRKKKDEKEAGLMRADEFGTECAGHVSSDEGDKSRLKRGKGIDQTRLGDVRKRRSGLKRRVSIITRHS